MTTHALPVVSRRRTPVLVVAALALVGAGTALRDTASAQDPAGRTLALTELEKGSTFVHIRNTKAKSQRSISQGDLIVFTNPLADASGARVGKLHAQCVATVGARNFLKSTLTCLGILALKDGTLTIQTLSSPGVPATTAAVTGGTGAYANARGVYTSTQNDAGDSADTITLVAG